MYLTTGASSFGGDTTKRQERMRSLVLDAERFEQFQGAVVATLELFQEIVSGDEEKSHLRITGLLERLETLDKEKWRAIRMSFPNDPYYGHVTGNFTDSEMSDLCKLLLDLLKRLDKIQEGVLKRMDEVYDSHKEYKAQAIHFKAQVKTLTSQYEEAKYRSESSKDEVTSLRAQVLSLHKELGEKRDTINRLQRDGTVQLWQKESERILSDSASKIKLLEEQKAKLQEDNERMRRIMDKKIAEVGQQNKMLKMKQELAGSKTMTDQSSASKDEFNKMKNENYLLQKDLTVLEKELQREQILFAGVLNGIRQDASILSQKYKTQSYGDMLDHDMSKLTDRIDAIHAQSLSGKLWTETDLLPVHYKDTKQNVAITKTRRLSAFGRSGRLSPIDKDLTKHKLEQTDKQNSVEKFNANPQIADPATGKINSTLALKHFPAISQSSMKEHWEQFTKFDSDCSGYLDFLEVLRAIQTTIGFQFSPTQIEKSYEEVDVNNSGTIDFFEYLTITQLLINRSGKSELFQSGVAKTRSAVISKTCSVQ